MSLGTIENPFVPIVGLTGAGLNGGRLYIGEDGKDPETDPQQCYWDAAGTIPAVQPIDIQGGYPMRLGTPTQVFTASTYSIRVRDRQGQQVFYLPSAVPGATTRDGIFESMADARSANIPPSVRGLGVTLLGYYEAQDGGGASYRYVAVEPAHPGKFQSADGAWWELAESTVDIRMLGARGGGADDGTAINDALTIPGVSVVAPAEDFSTSVPIVVGGLSWLHADGGSLIPLANINVVEIGAGADFYGAVDVSGVVGWNAAAISISGDAETSGFPFRLGVPTRVRAKLTGSVGVGNGTALKAHADGVPTARIMAVECDVDVTGFEHGYYLRQTSADGSRFVTSSSFRGQFDRTVRSLYMESSHVNGYHLDGNSFWIRHQPLPGTNVPAMVLRGQSNSFDLIPWDWDSVAGTAPKAVTVSLGVRRSTLLFWSDPAYLDWQTVDHDNQLLVPHESGGMYLDRVLPRSADGLIRLLGADVRLDNNRSLKLRKADGTGEYPAIYANPDDTLTIQGLPNEDVTVNIRKDGGLLTIRDEVNGNLWYISKAGVVRSDGGYLGAFVTPVPAATASPGKWRDWSAGGGFLYICVADNTWARVALSVF